MKDQSDNKNNHLKKIEVRLIESEANLNTAQAMTHLGHWRLGSKTLKVTGSDELFRIFGLTREEATLETFAAVVHPDDREFDLRFINRGLESGESWDIEHRLICKDGTLKYVHAIGEAIIDESGKVLHLIGTVQDITERKLVELALQQSEERFRTIINNAPIAIALLDMEGHLQITNKALQQMVGYSGKQLAQMVFTEFTHPEDVDADMKLYNELVAGDRNNYQMEKRYIHKNGRTVWGNLNVSLIRDNNGQPQAVIGMVKDITERKKVEEDIQNHQKKLKALASQLTLTEERERRKVAEFLHDEIGQKLALTMMKLGSLGQSLMAEGYQTATDEIQDLIESIIQDTRMATFELSPPILYELGLEPSLEWLCEQFGEKSSIQFLFHNDEKPKPLEEDVRIILFHAVKELLMNAIKYSYAKTVDVAVCQQKNQIHVSVKDNGNGFDPTTLQTYSLKKGGFGLFNIRERMEECGGRLDIKSELGKGTRMDLTAPLADRMDTPNK